MITDALIERLAASVKPVPRHAAARGLLLSLLGGALLTLCLIQLALLFRPDFAAALRSFAFWMKFFYTAGIGLVATRAISRLGRPEPVRLAAFWPVLVPVAVLTVMAVIQLAGSPLVDWRPLWLGSTYTQCSARVLILALPILAALLAWLRRLAPTQLRAAGALAGLAAGGWSATLYGLHCQEVAAPFVLTWYTLGMMLSGAVGALLGPRALRW